MNTLLFTKFPFDILYLILQYDGRWRYDKVKNEFISIIHSHDFRYQMLDDALYFYMENGYEKSSFSWRSNTFRMGCVVPIRSLQHLPYYMSCCNDNNFIISESDKVQRFLHVAKIIEYKKESTTQIMRIFSSKHSVYIDSSDTDVDDNDCDFKEYYD